jgi:hypothetical protein
VEIRNIIFRFDETQEIKDTGLQMPKDFDGGTGTELQRIVFVGETIGERRLLQGVLPKSE